MKIFGFQITGRQRTEGIEQRSAPPALLWENSTATPTVLSNAYEQVVWVYRAVNALAEQVANIPFRFSVSSSDGEQHITSGPLHEFYARPHPLLNRFQYWEMRVIWLMLRGECFRIPVLGPGGRLQRILMLDPVRFEEIISDHQIVGWRYRDYDRNAPLTSQVLLPEEVWYDRLPNPFNFWRGLPPLALAAVPAQTDYAASLHMRGIIENNGEAGIIVRTPDPLDEEQREQLLAALRDRKRRAGRADRPMLLPGNAEIITPKLASSDVQFLANRKFTRSEICAAFGVPEEIVTSTDAAKYDVMAGARLNFIENRVVPLCRRLQAEEDVTVKMIDPSASGWFDVDDHPVLQQARRTRLAAARSGWDMGIPLNELNKSFDLGFRNFPWGDTGYVAGGAKPVGKEEVES